MNKARCTTLIVLYGLHFKPYQPQDQLSASVHSDYFMLMKESAYIDGVVDSADGISTIIFFRINFLRKLNCCNSVTIACVKWTLVFIGAASSVNLQKFWVSFHPNLRHWRSKESIEECTRDTRSTNEDWGDFWYQFVFLHSISQLVTSGNSFLRTCFFKPHH